MPARLRSLVFTVLIYLAFFASGASCLITEVTWNRMLIVVVGNSLSAAAMIIAVFMGGLGLGSYLGGRIFSRRRSSLVPYLLLELCIGAYVLLSPAIFHGLTALFTSLAESVDNRSLLTLVRMLVSLAALLLPACLMGATFPAMVAGTALADPQRRTGRTGYLYSVNTLGAALGCFAAGYHLLFEFGVQTTLNTACGLYALAALCALAANALRRDAGPAPAEASVGSAARPNAAPAPAATSLDMRRFLMPATFGVGFVSLAYEVLLTRIAILYLGNSVSVFPLVLTAFLLGTGVSAIAGTWLYGALQRRGRGADRMFGILAILAGVLVLATPFVLLTDLVVGMEPFARLVDAAPRNPLPILLVLIAPTIVIGALLPVAIRILNPSASGEATREAATLYTANTAGGLIGAAIANHFLVPWIGVQGVLFLLTGICLFIGLRILVRPGEKTGAAAAGIALGITAGVVLLLAVSLPSLMTMYAGKIAGSTRAATAEVKLVHEGRAATVTVIDQADPKLGTYRDMYLNGVEEASTRFWHTQLFKLLGILPVLTHERDEGLDALVIAFGAGITAGSVLASDAVASLDVVDLNPDIEGINDLFVAVNGDVYHQERFHFTNDDGRNYLVTSNKQYDLIIGDSTHPRAYDSWILYTEEFYRAVKQRLAPDGVFAQWVPVLGSMRGQLFQIHLNTFRRVFPTATFWYVYGSDQAFLMATPASYTMDADRLARQLEALPAWFKADHYQIDTPTRLAGFFWLDEAAMTRMIGPETRVNTDGIHYFDKQSAVFPLPPQWQLPVFQAALTPHIRGGDASLRQAAAAEQAMARRMANYAFYRSRPDLLRAYCARPDNGNARYFMAEIYGDEIPEQAAFCREQEIQDYRALVTQHPDNVRALNGLADLLAKDGRLPEALEFAARALALVEGGQTGADGTGGSDGSGGAMVRDRGMVLDTYGWVLSLQGRHQEALAALEKSLTALPDHPIVLYHLGAARARAGDHTGARAALTRALSGSEEFEGAAEARALLATL